MESCLLGSLNETFRKGKLLGSSYQRETVGTDNTCFRAEWIGKLNRDKKGVPGYPVRRSDKDERRVERVPPI